MMRLTQILFLALVIPGAGCVSSKTDTPEARNQQASLELARQMVGQGEYNRAVQFLFPQSRSDDAPTEVHMLLGLSFIGMNNPDAASKSFTTVLKKEPKNDDAKLNLAYTQIIKGRHTEARKLLHEIMERGTYLYRERVHLNIGLTYMQQKRCDKAVKEFSAALEIEPTYSASYFNIGKCQLTEGRIEEARVSFKRAVDFCPGCLEPQLELAAVAHRLGDKREAIKHLDQVLSAKPDANTEKRAMALRKQMTR